MTNFIADILNGVGGELGISDDWILVLLIVSLLKFLTLLGNGGGGGGGGSGVETEI